MPSLSENIPTGYIVPTGYITEVPYIELQGVGVERTLFEPEHELFRESYQKFLAQHVAPNHEKWEEQNIVDRDVWVEAGKQGFLGTAVPEEFGGGGVKDFLSTGQCAAGGARILETIAHLLRLMPSELGDIALRSTAPAPYSAGCPVFAESEAISLLIRGTSAEDLLAGLHRALAAKILALARSNLRAGARALAGGGAKDAGLVARIRADCQSLLVPLEPMIVPALGAALAAD